jgi:hypothetical protein
VLATCIEYDKLELIGLTQGYYDEASMAGKTSAGKPGLRDAVTRSKIGDVCNARR